MVLFEDGLRIFDLVSISRLRLRGCGALFLEGLDDYVSIDMAVLLDPVVYQKVFIYKQLKSDSVFYNMSKFSLFFGTYHRLGCNHSLSKPI